MRKIRINTFLEDVKDYYFITEDGDVISYARKNAIKLKPGIKKNGYAQVTLVKNDGGLKYISVHRLVAICFLNNEWTNDKLTVNHKDGDKLNNSLGNLEWLTSKENIEHSWENKLSKSISGERSNLSKITEDTAKEIVRLLRTNNFTDREIYEKTGASIRGTISRIRRRETWKHLTNDKELLGKSQKRK